LAELVSAGPFYASLSFEKAKAEIWMECWNGYSSSYRWRAARRPISILPLFC